MILRYSGAMLYDVLIAMTLLLAFTALCLPVCHHRAIEPGTLWYQAGLSLAVTLYYLLSLKYGGQTIGMRAFRLKIVSGNNRLTVLQILARGILTLPIHLLACLLFTNAETLLFSLTRTRMVCVSA